MTQQPPEPREGAPEWMVSYADMITIMMAFFVVMYASAGAVSTGKERGEKTGQGAQPLADARGSAGEGRQGIAGKNDADPKLAKVIDSLHWRFGPEWTIANCWKGGPPQLRQGGDGTVLRAPGNRNRGKPAFGQIGDDAARARGPRPGDAILAGGRVFFDEFSSDLAEEQQQRLRRVAEDMAGKLQKIELRGHTSRRALPPGSPYRDHWDLAYDRCRKVREFLIGQGIDPRRIRLAVAANNEPLEIDGDPLPARRHSRVDLHGLNEYLDSPAGAGEQQKGAS
jgi:chemotaxis protein MotB